MALPSDSEDVPVILPLSVSNGMSRFFDTWTAATNWPRFLNPVDAVATSVPVGSSGCSFAARDGGTVIGAGVLGVELVVVAGFWVVVDVVDVVVDGLLLGGLPRPCAAAGTANASATRHVPARRENAFIKVSSLTQKRKRGQLGL